MSIVTPEYFEKGNLFIPNNNNLNTVIPGVPNVDENLQLFIDVFERELLVNALGITLYDEFVAELPVPTTQKWIDLLDGVTYSTNGKSYRWDGLVGFEMQSLIAFYIYCQYLRNGSTVYTTTGTVLLNSANSQNVDPTPKYIVNYNNFLKRYQGDNHQYCNNNPNVIINRSGMVGLDYSKTNNESFVNLYQYLTDQNTLTTNPEPFPDFEFKFYYNENSWGV